jgi:hypothetical protein
VDIGKQSAICELLWNREAPRFVDANQDVRWSGMLGAKMKELSCAVLELKAMTDDDKPPISITALRAEDYSPDAKNITLRWQQNTRMLNENILCPLNVSMSSLLT